MRPFESNPPPLKISPRERRKLIAIAVKTGKSQRLIARELNITETTIRRDLKALGIPANKKPAATRRKPAGVFKARSRATSDGRVASLNLIRLPPAPLNQPTPPRRRIVLPERPKPRTPEPPSPEPPEIPPSPEQLRRQQHLEEMLLLVQSWLRERKPDYWRAANVLDKARNHLAAGFPGRSLPESPMSAEHLRDHNRPPEMAAVRPWDTHRLEEICALWLARWLAAWEPNDKQLRTDVLDLTRAKPGFS